MSILYGLNKEQQEAVQEFSRPVLVIAGPGTGKTTVLTRKIQYILKNTDIKPYMILALTFSESAAINMRRRLSKLVGRAAYDVNIFTFHGFANFLIETFVDEFPDYKERTVLNEVERISIFREILLDRTLPLERLISLTDRLTNLKKIMRYIEVLKREGITPEQLANIIKIEKEVLENLPKESKRSKDGLTTKYRDQLDLVKRLEELHIIFTEYEKRLARHKKLDFSDMINIVNQRFSQSDDFSLKVQEMFEYILVDEYQDTNRAQNTLLFNLLSFWGDNPNVFVVGDDDQAIYRFQGASVQNLFDFIQRFPNYSQVVLTQNYRSHQIILDAAASVRNSLYESVTTDMTQLQRPISKHLTAANKDVDKQRDKIRVAQFPNETSELFWLVDQIKKLHKEGVQYEDIAILVRKNVQVNEIAEFLLKNKIPYTKSTGTNIFENPYVLQILNVLRFLNNPDISLFNRILHYPFWGVKVSDVARFLQVVNSYYSDVHSQVAQTKRQIISSKLSTEGASKTPVNERGHSNKDTPSSRTHNQVSLFDAQTHSHIDEAGPLVAEFDFEFLKELLQKVEIDPSSKKAILSIIDNLLLLHSQAKVLPAVRLIEHILHDAGMLDYIMQQPTKFEDLNAINTLLQNVKALALDKTEFYLSDFLRVLELIERFDISIAGQNLLTPSKGVRIMTVHSAKGLEFGYVFIPKFTASAWSTRFRSDLLTHIDYFERPVDFGSDQVRKELVQLRLEAINKPKAYRERKHQLTKDDERRLFYVALTRAKFGVYISFSEQSFNQFGKIREESVAEFIFDIPEDLIKELDTSIYNVITQDANIKTLFKPTDLPGFYISTASEKEYLRELLKRFKLSPSALITYLSDPVEFYLNYFLKLPGKTNLHLVYGEAFHKTIEIALKHYKDTRQIMDIVQLKEEFKRALSEYFLTPDEQADLLKRADKELRLYYKHRFMPSLPYPLFVEKVLYANFQGHIIKGKLDKVETIDFDKRHVRIVDIKTARYRSRKDLLGLTKNSETLAGFGSSYLIQLYFYKLLFDLDPRIKQGYNWQAISGAIDFTRPVSYAKGYLPAPVTIEFEQTKYEEFKQIVKQVLQEIYSLEFLKKVE